MDDSSAPSATARSPSVTARECVAFLNTLTEQPALLAELSNDERAALIAAAGRFTRPSGEEKSARRKARRASRRNLVVRDDRAARAQTGIRRARAAAAYVAPAEMAPAGPAGQEAGPRLAAPRRCYVCNNEYVNLHFFYDSMCGSCGDFNYRKRFQSAPLDGRVALITGARLKIGYQAALLLLRAGATVIVTTRFPVDAALRFSREDDFSAWGNRLQICGLDLRHTPSVETFVDYVLGSYARLDILINNAAQTVRRPPAFYAHLMEQERRSVDELPEAPRALLRLQESLRRELQGSMSAAGSAAATAVAPSWQGRYPGMGIHSSAELSQIPYTHDDTLPAAALFPEGRLDADLQQVDLRNTNSWRLRIGEISTAEMLELQLINAVAPFVLCNRLVPMMRRDFTGEKHIVNVSAIEGKFFRFKKPDRHPHTNMAKAALNMLTHTSASDLAKDGIFMNAVDTGWVTDEDPAVMAREREDSHDFQPPLDIVDGAARVCDPFFDGILTGNHWCGKFLKDYRPIDW